MLDKLNEQLEIASEIFLLNKDSFLNSSTFKYTIEHFSNKNINIHDLRKEVGKNAPNLLTLTVKIKPMLTDRNLKTELTKLSNLLF